MIDFIKFQISNTSPEYFEKHPLLDFKGQVDCETKEKLSNNVYAFYKGLKFNIFTHLNDKGFIMYQNVTLEGSLHKYWNNGEHNFNDFTTKDIYKVLEDLKNKFNIDPSYCVLKQFEIGVNIDPKEDTDTILENCLLHKTKLLKWIYVPNEGNYKQARYQNHIIKIYNKQLHYAKKFENVKPTLRFEIKYLRMRKFHNMDIRSLQDLLDFGLYNFKDYLLKEWNSIIFYDYKVLDGSLYEDKYSNANYWAKLNKSNFKFHRGKLNEFINHSKKSIKKMIEQLISFKFDSLMTDSVQSSSYYIARKRTA